MTRTDRPVDGAAAGMGAWTRRRMRARCAAAGGCPCRRRRLAALPDRLLAPLLLLLLLLLPLLLPAPAQARSAMASPGQNQRDPIIPTRGGCFAFIIGGRRPRGPRGAVPPSISPPVRATPPSPLAAEGKGKSGGAPAPAVAPAPPAAAAPVAAGIPTTASDPAASPPPPLPMPVIAFPGGGIYFYWQAGAVHYLQQHFDLGRARLVGASAGALTAALAGCGVDMPYAAEVALKMSMNMDLWKRPLGLAGVWGGLVRRWLDDLLPQDAAERCRHRVHLYVNLVERRALQSSALPLRRERVSDFRDRKELVETCLASVHIPFFMDGRPLMKLGDKGLVLDGSFRLTAAELEEGGQALVLDHYKDPAFRAGTGATDFVTLVSPEGIKGMMRAGYRYARQLHEAGQLGQLAPIAKGRWAHDEDEEHHHHQHQHQQSPQSPQSPQGHAAVSASPTHRVQVDTGVRVLYDGSRSSSSSSSSPPPLAPSARRERERRERQRRGWRDDD